MITRIGIGCGAAALVALLCMNTTMSAQGGVARGSAPGAFDPHDVSGFWVMSFESRKVPTAKLLPRVTRAMLDLHTRRDVHAMRWCNFLGVPFVMDSGTPIDIRQGRTMVIIAPENNPAPRYLYLGRKHVNPEIYDPTTGGDSIANWEGDTLVADTIGFHPTRGVTSIPGGGFKTDKSHLVERYRLLENGSVLSVTFTWTDPTVFAAPHTYEFRYRRLPATYEPPVSTWSCDPYNETRAQFVGDPAPFNSSPR
jgi:hypothetical protein